MTDHRAVMQHACGQLRLLRKNVPDTMWPGVDAALSQLSAAIAQPEQTTALTEPACSDHPDAPHGFDRNASHSAHRYVCDCEGWMPDE